MLVICWQIQQERAHYSDAYYREHTKGSGAYLQTEQADSGISQNQVLLLFGEETSSA